MLDSPFNIILIGVCVIAVLYLIYRMFFDKPTTSITKSSSYDEDAVNRALKAGNIKTTAEHFQTQDTIVFDRPDIMSNNFTKFINIYLPNIIDIKFINDNLNRNGIDKTTTDIDALSKIPFCSIFSSDLSLLIAQLITFIGTPTDKIVFGIGLLMNNNLLMQHNTNVFSKSNKSNHPINYYLNNYDKVGDFEVYFVPTDYTGNIQNLAEDKTLLDLTDSILTSTSREIPRNIVSKIKLFKYVKNIIQMTMMQGRTTSALSISLLDQLENIMINNKVSYMKYINYIIAAIYIAKYKNLSSLSADLPIVTDIDNFLNNSNTFTQEFKSFNNNTFSKNNFISFVNNQLNREDPWLSVEATVLDNNTTKTGILKLYSGENNQGTYVTYDISNAGEVRDQYDYNRKINLYIDASKVNNGVIKSMQLVPSTDFQYNIKIFYQYQSTDDFLAEFQTATNIPQSKTIQKYIDRNQLVDVVYDKIIGIEITKMKPTTVRV
jgi:hypothetical protein